MSSGSRRSGERGLAVEEMKFQVLRATPDDKDDLLFRASKDKAGDSKSSATCTHCNQAIATRKEGFFCEVADCPAVYHELCIEVAVAKALFDKPALLKEVILCPLCSRR